MPRKIDYSFWLEPPDPGTDEEYDIPAVARELDERFPEVLRKWPDIRLRRSKLPSGLPRVDPSEHFQPWGLRTGPGVRFRNRQGSRRLGDS